MPPPKKMRTSLMPAPPDKLLRPPGLLAFAEEDSEPEQATVSARHSVRIEAPRAMKDVFLWAFVLLQSFSQLLGAVYVRGKLGSVHWRLSTYFSGMDCAVWAVEQLKAAAMEMFSISLDIKFGSACEINKACQRWLTAESMPDRCVFGDLLQFGDERTRNCETENVDDIKLHDTHMCLKHNKLCPRNVEAPGHINVDVSGPPCVLFSNYGLRQGFANKAKAQVHHVWVRCKQVDETPVILHENVPGFPEALRWPSFQGSAVMH